jgi:hypothetical protein
MENKKFKQTKISVVLEGILLRLKTERRGIDVTPNRYSYAVTTVLPN